MDVRPHITANVVMVANDRAMQVTNRRWPHCLLIEARSQLKLFHSTFRSKSCSDPCKSRPGLVSDTEYAGGSRHEIANG